MPKHKYKKGDKVKITTDNIKGWPWKGDFKIGDVGVIRCRRLVKSTSPLPAKYEVDINGYKGIWLSEDEITIIDKQLCYKCKHNTTGEIMNINGKEKCVFDCDLTEHMIIEDFNADCENFVDERVGDSHDD